MNFKHLFLFIVCPNNSGSTLLAKLLGTSPNVSLIRNTLHEGVCVRKARAHMPRSSGDERRNCTINEEKFMNNANYNWPKIKAAWFERWNISKSILVEKSPQSVLRAHLTQNEFENTKFIINLRNPYAFCEGIRRKMGHSLTVAATHWLKCAEHQIRNKRTLKGNIFFSYEEMCDDTLNVCKNLVNFIPELQRLDPNRAFNRKRYEKVFGLENQNNKQISKLKKRDFIEINDVLGERSDLMEHFGYKYCGKQKG